MIRQSKKSIFLAGLVRVLPVVFILLVCSPSAFATLSYQYLPLENYRWSTLPSAEDLLKAFTGSSIVDSYSINNVVSSEIGVGPMFDFGFDYSHTTNDFEAVNIPNSEAYRYRNISNYNLVIDGSALSGWAGYTVVSDYNEVFVCNVVCTVEGDGLKVSFRKEDNGSTLTYGDYMLSSINIILADHTDPDYLSDGANLPNNLDIAAPSQVTIALNFKNVLTGNFAGSLYSSSNAVGVSAVPVPAAAWLFGLALTGLVGIKRKNISRLR